VQLAHLELTVVGESLPACGNKKHTRRKIAQNSLKIQRKPVKIQEKYSQKSDERVP
jgi:hypothetical protein